MLNVRIRLLNKDATVPEYSKEGDAGLDLVATGFRVLTPDIVEYYTGLTFEIPSGYVGLVYPRSSLSKKSLVLSNSVGLIDSGFRGEVTLRFRIASIRSNSEIYQKGDRVGQIMIVPYPQVNLVISDELTETERGSGGYGSTGA